MHYNKLRRSQYLLLLSAIFLNILKIYIKLLPSTDVFNNEDLYDAFDFNIKYLIKPSTSSAKVPLTIVMVATTANETVQREQIRSSWANLSEFDAEFVRVEFLMGTTGVQLSEELKIEAKAYNDIVVANIKEGYYHLADKTMAMLDYKSRYFPSTKCLVKADIDNVLVLHNYIRLCEETAAPLIVGKCDVSRYVKRKTTKWAVPESVWPDPKYPKYCSTGTYTFIGKNLPKRLNELARSGKFASSMNFRKLAEDVIFTGILAEQTKTPRHHMSGFSFFSQPEFICRNGFLHTFSIHMHRDKNANKYYKKLMMIEGERCRWWHTFDSKKWDY